VPEKRQRISSGSPFEPKIGFTRALRAGDRVLVSGTGPVWPDGSFDPDPAAQTRRVLEIIVAALKEAGAEPADVVRTGIYIADAADFEAIGAVHAEFFGAAPPASLCVVTGLLDPRWRVEIEAEAMIG
jgi:enamine deaminase RidA (YjgF/YER057c/UK114 family)